MHTCHFASIVQQAKWHVCLLHARLLPMHTCQFASSATRSGNATGRSRVMTAHAAISVHAERTWRLWCRTARYRSYGCARHFTGICVAVAPTPCAASKRAVHTIHMCRASPAVYRIKYRHLHFLGRRHRISICIRHQSQAHLRHGLHHQVHAQQAFRRFTQRSDECTLGGTGLSPQSAIITPPIVHKHT